MAKDIPRGNGEHPVERMREEVQTLLGTRGDPLDAAITFRNAIERGMLDRLGRALAGTVTYVNNFPTSGSSGASATPDMTAPPAVAGLVVSAGFTSILVQFTAPTYTTRSGTASNLRTNIYAVKKAPADATLPTFAAGVTPLVSAAAGTLNIVSIPSEPNTRWHVWARHMTVDGVESTGVAGGVNGYNAAGAYPTTGQDVAQLLAVLAGQITESQLHRALNEPIRSIIRRADDAAEDALRAAVATHNAARRAADALLIEAQDRGTSITETRTIAAAGDAQVAGTVTALTAVVGLNAAAIQTEATARADGDSAEAAARQVLEVRVNNPTDTNNPTYAALSTEASVRASQTGSILASQSVKMELNGHMSGYGLTSSLVAGGTPTSMFIVSVDKFAVVTPPTSVTNWTAGAAIGVNEIRGVAGNTDKVLVCKTPGTTGGTTPAIAGALGTTLQDGGVAWQIASRVPFAVLTVPTLVSGVMLPAGSHFDAAYVLNGTIKKAQLGDAIIDDAKIIDVSAGKLRTGAVEVGADISSAGFVAGSTGWRIQGVGTVEFQSGTFRGTIYAAAGLIGGNTIDATGIQSPGYTAGSTGFRFDTSGLLRAFASSGARVFDMAATGTAPVLKIGSVFEVLADGSAYFGGGLAVGAVTALSAASTAYAAGYSGAAKFSHTDQFDVLTFTKSNSDVIADMTIQTTVTGAGSLDDVFYEHTLWILCGGYIVAQQVSNSPGRTGQLTHVVASIGSCMRRAVFPAGSTTLTAHIGIIAYYRSTGSVAPVITGMSGHALAFALETKV